MNARMQSPVRSKMGIAAALLILAALLWMSLPAAGVTKPILVYTGNDSINHGYTKFAAAAGRTLETNASLPSDLTGYECLILPINRTTFGVSQKTAIANYVNTGGTVLALGEFKTFSPSSVATMNDLAASLGSGLSLQGDDIDLGFHVTSNIHATPWTAGVSTIKYAATSRLVATAPAQALVSTQGGVPFIGAESLGDGLFVLSGDSNAFSDNSSDAYTAHDNGVLAANLCGEAQVQTVDIDVKPGSNDNVINLRSRGVIPVAILSGAGFDATTVDPATVCFGSAHNPTARACDEAHGKSHTEDVDGDGDTDLLFHFNTQEAGIQPGDTDACLNGETLSGQAIEGCDTIATK